MTDNATSATAANAEGIFEPFHVSRVPTESFAKGERFGISFQHLSSFGGGSQISVSMEVLAPRKQANQAHYHLLEEEHIFILDGALTVRIGDKSYAVTAGFYMCFPAGQKHAHSLVNRTTQPCRYLVLGNPHKHDVAVFPETGRVNVKLAGESYRTSPALDYWAGVDMDRKA